MRTGKKILHGLFLPVTPWPFPPACVCRGGPPDTFLVQWTVALFKFIVPRSLPSQFECLCCTPPSPLFLQDEGKKSPFLPLFDPLSPPPPHLFAPLVTPWMARWRVCRETPFVLIAFHPRGGAAKLFSLLLFLPSFCRLLFPAGNRRHCRGREGGNDRCFFSIPYSSSSSLPQKKPFIYLMQARGGEGDRGRIKMGINTERGRVFPPIAVSSS